MGGGVAKETHGQQGGRQGMPSHLPAPRHPASLTALHPASCHPASEQIPSIPQLHPFHLSP